MAVRQETFDCELVRDVETDQPDGTSRSQMRSTSLKNRSCPNSPLVKKSYRLVVLGSTQTGKTSIVSRFLNDEYSDRYIPTIENFHRKMYKARGELYQLDILDTSGNDPFPAARRVSLLAGDLFLLVCSVDLPASFDEVFNLREQIIDCKRFSNNEPAVPVVIALNKTDLPSGRHQVRIENARDKVAKLHDCSFVTVSAKTGEGVSGIFSELFTSAKMPKQMNPNRHRALTAEHSADAAVSNTRKSPLLRLRSKLSRESSDATTSWGESNIRKPSLRTDMFLKTKSSSRSLDQSPGSPKLGEQGRSVSMPQNRGKCTLM